MSEITAVERGSAAWDVMWQAVAAHPLNTGLADPMAATEEVSGETWQDMGTSNGLHSLRHRHHPRTEKREYIEIPALNCVTLH